MQNNFSRSNVNESTLSISNPARSTFDLSHRESFTAKLGRFLPVSIESLMPGDTFSGSIAPSLTLERVRPDVPSVGQIRLDTHTFFVARRRINSALRRDLQGMMHSRVSTFPHFDFHKVAAMYLRALAYLVNDEDDRTSISSILDDDNAVCRSGNIQSFIGVFISAYRSLANDMVNRYAYMQDFFKVEVERLTQLSDYYATTTSGSWYEVLANILEPLFGIGSVADMLGYPIIKPLNIVNSGSKSFADLSLDTALRVKGYRNNSFQLLDNGVVSDEQIKAAYACWYDYMRDWHLEPSETAGIYNPDDFDGTTIFNFGNSIGSASDAKRIITICAQMLVVKYRYWSRDMLTTVQPDDVYRHVYTPILGSENGQIDVHTRDSSAVDSAVNMLIGEGQFAYDNVPFLGDFLFQPTAEDTVAVLRQDLHTMRRAHMLEKWLARNYYHPDTFSGYIEARYGQRPADSMVLLSQYLGGSESFISGEQAKNPTATADTPAGSRTFMGAASTSDNFSYSTIGEFGFLISFVSLVPLCKYDALNTHLYELTTADIPQPEFAIDTRCTISAGDVVRGLSRDVVLGYVPRYIQWRTRVDGAHGRYLTDYKDYDFMRDAQSMSTSDGATTFTLSPYQLRIHPNMDAFAGLKEWDDVAFGDVECQLHIQRALPAAIEFI